MLLLIKIAIRFRILVIDLWLLLVLLKIESLMCGMEWLKQNNRIIRTLKIILPLNIYTKNNILKKDLLYV